MEYQYRYGKKDAKYEVIKVIRACRAGFQIGNAIEYIARADKKGNRAGDLAKALDYLKMDRAHKIPEDFVHLKGNDFTPAGCAIAWELDEKLTEVLLLIWYGNIDEAIKCLSTS